MEELKEELSNVQWNIIGLAEIRIKEERLQPNSEKTLYIKTTKIAQIIE